MTDVMASTSSSSSKNPPFYREYFHNTQLGLPHPPVRRSASSTSISSKTTDENDPESGFGVKDGGGPHGIIFFCKDLEQIQTIPPLPHTIRVSTSYTSCSPPSLKSRSLPQTISGSSVNNTLLGARAGDRSSRNLKSPSSSSSVAGGSDRQGTLTRGSREISASLLAAGGVSISDRTARQSNRTKTLSPSNRDSVSSPRDSAADKRRTKIKTKRKSDNERLARKEEKRKRAHGPPIVVRCIDDFPEEAVKLLRKTKISDENFMEFLNVTVHIIRFRTGYNVRTEEEMLKKAKEQQQHAGVSLSHSSSVSTSTHPSTPTPTPTFPSSLSAPLLPLRTSGQKSNKGDDTDTHSSDVAAGGGHHRKTTTNTHKNEKKKERKDNGDDDDDDLQKDGAGGDSDDNGEKKQKQNSNTTTQSHPPLTPELSQPVPLSAVPQALKQSIQQQQQQQSSGNTPGGGNNGKRNTDADSEALEANIEPKGGEELISPGDVKKLYKSLQQAGRGGFGSVFVAKSSLDKCDVAVKKLPHTTKKTKRTNFNEIGFLNTFKHPNIVRYYRSHLLDDELWLVMEYMQGGTLAESVERYSFVESSVAYVAREVLKALEYLHNLNFVHRDLKSANIMLTVEGRIKLIDFGLCVDQSQRKLCHMAGSPFWMPPEMILGLEHGSPADIWSFAICLLELINGEPPNRKSPVKAMFVAATEGISVKNEKYSPEFKDFLSRCLQIDQTKRAPASELLKHEFLKKADTQETMKKILAQIFISNAINNLDYGL
eukprot:TRINITY_DN1686_c1_g1_i4.p1 TRINITY_DN1686_c1_g1~~TRINITY_DN1686_c1_g1_i4.p1  ORF type:complete len:767 (+),score=235.94 TRINITY_DN1686_c1_g1_i4:238-2538(+)